MCKGISSITCFSCNPVLKMQASKLLIKRLLYNLQNQKHNEFPSCTSIRIVINNLLKGKQRSNPPSRYLKERRRKYPSAASDQNIYETNNFWWRQICEVISVLYSKTVFVFPALHSSSLQQPHCKWCHTDSQKKRKQLKKPCFWTYRTDDHFVAWLMVVVSQGLNWYFPIVLYKSNALLWSHFPSCFGGLRYMDDFAHRIGWKEMQWTKQYK